MPNGDWKMMYDAHKQTYVQPPPFRAPSDECSCDQRCPKCGKLKKVPSYNPHPYQPLYPWGQNITIGDRPDLAPQITC